MFGSRAGDGAVPLSPKTCGDARVAEAVVRAAAGIRRRTQSKNGWLTC